MTAATQNNRQFTLFYWHLMGYEGITQSAVLVYGYLLAWQKSAKDPDSHITGVFPSYDHIGNDLGMSPDTAKRAVNILEKLGFLTRTRRSRRMSYLYTVVELDDLPSVAPAAEQEPTVQGPAYEHVNDSPVQNDECEGDVHQGSGDQIANDCHAVGSPIGTAPDIDTTSFTAAFAVAETFAVDIPDEEPVTALEWLDAAFLPNGELKQVAVQYCLEHGVTDPEEQKYFVRKLVDPDYVREKPIHNPAPAAAPEWEDLSF